MIKFTAMSDKGLLVGFGLSYGNLEKLKKGEPILINLEELGMGKGEVMIFAGPTEEAMEKDLQQYIGPDTIHHRGSG